MRHPAPLPRAFAGQAPIPSAQGDRPTRRRPARSPLRSPQSPTCGGGDERIALIAHLVAHTIHRFGDFIRSVACHVLSERFAEYAAAGLAAPSRQALRLLEHVVRNRDRRFHTISITIRQASFNAPPYAIYSEP